MTINGIIIGVTLLAICILTFFICHKVEGIVANSKKLDDLLERKAIVNIVIEYVAGCQCHTVSELMILLEKTKKEIDEQIDGLEKTNEQK